MGVASLRREIKMLGAAMWGSAEIQTWGGLKQRVLLTAQPSVSPALEPVCLFVCLF